MINTPLFSLKEKVAIVTGGRRGMGSAIAQIFAEAGADVVVSDVVASEELKSIAEEIKKLGRRSLALECDVSKKTDVDKMVKKVKDEFGHIDILMNCAGIMGPEGPVIELSEKDWYSIIDINLKGCFLCSQAVAKIMIEQNNGGSIISIASRNAVRAEPAGRGAYSVSKAGIVMLTRALARELGPYNIRVNAIGPGVVKTEMTRFMWENPEFMKKFKTTVPLGRMAEPREIAGIALFLASDAASYVSGHHVLADAAREA